VLAGPCPVVTALLAPRDHDTIHREEEKCRWWVNGGFAEVNPQGLTVLADLAAPLEDSTRALTRRRDQDTEEDDARRQERAGARQAHPSHRQLKTLQAAIQPVIVAAVVGWVSSVSGLQSRRTRDGVCETHRDRDIC